MENPRSVNFYPRINNNKSVRYNDNNTDNYYQPKFNNNLQPHYGKTYNQNLNPPFDDSSNNVYNNGQNRHHSNRNHNYVKNHNTNYNPNYNQSHNTNYGSNYNQHRNVHRNNRNISSNMYEQQENYNGPQLNYQNNNLIETKSVLARYINKNVILSTFKYTIAEYKHDLELLNTGKYFVSPNYNGNLCLVVFVKILNKYYSYSIDKKTLSKNIQGDVDEIKMSKLNIRLDESIYNGTILDCTQLNMGTNLQKSFVINDVYMFRGENIANENIDNKLLNIDTYMKVIYKDDVLNDTTFVTNKLFELKEIKELINVYIPKSKLKNHVKGVTFYAQQNHTKLIYLFNNCCKPEKTEQQKKLTIRTADVNNNDGDVIAYFRIKKTETPDVYHLYLKKKGIKDGKKSIRLKKYCIAYVPTINVSYFCKDIFLSDTDNDLIIVKCKYCADKNKWIPFEHIKDRKYPDSYKDIESKYGLVDNSNKPDDDSI